MTANDRVRAVMEQLDIKQVDILEKVPALKQNTLSVNLKTGKYPLGALAAALYRHWGVNLNYIYTGQGRILLLDEFNDVVKEFLKKELAKYQYFDSKLDK